MIVDPDLPPTETTYYVAAKILRFMAQRANEDFDLATVLACLGDEPESVNVDAAILALDFLFLCGKVDVDDEGILTCI
jgi:hypothetical protein